MLHSIKALLDKRHLLLSQHQLNPEKPLNNNTKKIASLADSILPLNNLEPTIKPNSSNIHPSFYSFTSGESSPCEDPPNN